MKSLISQQMPKIRHPTWQALKSKLLIKSHVLYYLLQMYVLVYFLRICPSFTALRLPHRNDAKIAKICNLWAFSAVSQSGVHTGSAPLKRWLIDRITGQNVQRLRIFAILASFLWGNLKSGFFMGEKNLITYNSVSNPPHGQWLAPIGS